MVFSAGDRASGATPRGRPLVEFVVPRPTRRSSLVLTDRDQRPPTGTFHRAAPRDTAATMAVLTAEQLSEPLTRLRIGYDPALVPAGGAEVIGQCASPLADAMPSNIEAAGRGFHEKILIKTGAFASREGAARASKRFFSSIPGKLPAAASDCPRPTTPCESPVPSRRRPARASRGAQRRPRRRRLEPPD